MHRDQVLQTILEYMDGHTKERGLSRLLQHIKTHERFWSRDELTGHITCGAILINRDRRVLQIHHRSLGKWLFPGGHVEDSDRSLVDAALREMEEEVAIPRAQAINLFDDDRPIDINYHVIPANKDKSEPRHYHWDFRYAFLVTEDVTRYQSTEITHIAWRTLHDLREPIVTKLINLLADRPNKRFAG